MGGCFSSDSKMQQGKSEQQTPKVYSWDKRRTEINPDDYVYKNRKEETLIKQPGYFME
jgi:hypothetical protein